MGMVNPEVTKARKDAFIQALYECKGFVTFAYKAAGIPARTYYDWLKDDPEFKARVQEHLYTATEESIDIARSALSELIDKQNLSAIIYFLKCKAKHYGFGDDGTQPQIVMSKDDFNSLLNKLADEARAEY